MNGLPLKVNTMKNLNMWYNEKLDEYVLAALTGILASPDRDSNPYTIARQSFGMAKAMMEVREEYVKKD